MKYISDELIETLAQLSEMDMPPEKETLLGAAKDVLINPIIQHTAAEIAQDLPITSQMVSKLFDKLQRKYGLTIPIEWADGDTLNSSAFPKDAKPLVDAKLKPLDAGKTKAIGTAVKTFASNAKATKYSKEPAVYKYLFSKVHKAPAGTPQAQQTQQTALKGKPIDANKWNEMEFAMDATAKWVAEKIQPITTFVRVMVALKKLPNGDVEATYAIFHLAE